MSEPTSRSGEPDRFAAIERILDDLDACNYFYRDPARIPTARLELTAARDREAWQDEENNRAVFEHGIEGDNIARIEAIIALAAAEARLNEHDRCCVMCNPRKAMSPRCHRGQKLEAELATLKAAGDKPKT